MGKHVAPATDHNHDMEAAALLRTQWELEPHHGTHEEVTE